MVRDFNQVQMDIVFLLKYKDENDGYQYILSIIDILSRFAFAYGQKTKGGVETKENIEKAFEQYRERFGHYPKLVQFDSGVEFKNKLAYTYFESVGATYFSTYTPRKASVVERFNRTLKSKMMRSFEGEQNHRWIDNIDSFVDNYNDTVHSSIRMKPKDVSESNKFTVWGRLFSHLVAIKKPKYKIGDKVRVLNFDKHHRDMQLGRYFLRKYEVRDEKGKVKGRPVAVSAKNKPPFSEEIFEISNVLLGDPNVYKLYSREADESGYDGDIMGIFYEQELSLVSFESHKDSEE